MDDDTHGRAVRINRDWDWEAEWRVRRRRNIPLFGIFLILLGLFLILNDYVTQAQVAISAFWVCLGVVLLVVWLRDGNHAALYLGAIMVALALSDLLTETNVVRGDGWGTLFLGIAAALIALIRVARGGGWGWQIVVAVPLILLGGAEVGSTYANADLNGLAVPILIILLGLIVISRSRPAAMH